MDQDIFCKSNLVVIAPVAEAINKGMMEEIVRSSINTSRLKITAAMGVVKMDAMAPAAPQPISKIVFYSSF